METNWIRRDIVVQNLPLRTDNLYICIMWTLTYTCVVIKGMHINIYSYTIVIQNCVLHMLYRGSFALANIGTVLPNVNKLADKQICFTICIK